MYRVYFIDLSIKKILYYNFLNYRMLNLKRCFIKYNRRFINIFKAIYNSVFIAFRYFI